MRLSVALVSQPGTADSSTDDQLLAAMLGVSNDPFSSATGAQAVGLCSAAAGERGEVGTTTPARPSVTAQAAAAARRRAREFG